MVYYDTQNLAKPQRDILIKHPMDYLFEIDQIFENHIPTAFKNCVTHE